MDNFSGKIDAFIDSLSNLITQVKDVPMMIWQGVEGQLGMQALVICTALGIAAALYVTLISFFKGLWKEKLLIVFEIIIVIIVLLVIFYFALMR